MFHINLFKFQLTVWENDGDYASLLYQLKIFNCDEEVLEKRKTHIKRLIVDKMKKMNFLSIVNTLGSVIDYVTLFPGSGTCSIGFSVEPNKKYPMTHFRFGISHEPGKNIGLIISKMNNIETMNSLNIEVRNTTESNNVEYKLVKYSAENEIDRETCINIRQDISKHSLLGEIKFFDGNCSQNESIAFMKLEGRNTNEHDPNMENTMYKKCISNPMYKHIVCATEATAFRDYTIEMNYPGQSKRLLLQMHFPGNESELVDIVCKDPPLDVRVKLDYSSWPYWSMPQSAFGYKSIAFRENECEITMDRTTSITKQDHHFSLNNTWKLLLSDCDNSTCNWKIMAKRVSDVQETMVG